MTELYKSIRFQAKDFVHFCELRLPKGKRFKSKHLLLNNLKRLLIAFKVRSGLESN